MQRAAVERGIGFSDEMVRALLDGRKTQTRRIMKTQMVYGDVCGLFPSWYMPTGPESGILWPNGKEQILSMCPYGQPGDRLWVREAWADLEALSDGSLAQQAIYRADDAERYGDEDEYVDVTAEDMRWELAADMPRWASRIELEITKVGVEPVQRIGVEEIQAEGVVTSDEAIMEHGCRARVIDFSRLWESIYGPGSWDANPWVWVIEFVPVMVGQR